MSSPPGVCLHQWEDAQLRLTRDGTYVASFDYCVLCNKWDMTYHSEQVKLLRAALTYIDGVVRQHRHDYRYPLADDVHEMATIALEGGDVLADKA